MSIDPRSIPAATRAAQARAADPRASAWVSANAGSGKTHVLTERVIRLLLAGVDPARILCVTYTKAAAANMANRLFERLGAWTTMDDAALTEALTTMLGYPPASGDRARARRLFARALETPGGLKIQTIHAFCEAILHQFPLEANIAGHFELMDDRTAALVTATATRTVLTPGTPALDAAVSEALGLAGEHGLTALIEAIIRERGALRRFIEHLRTEIDDPETPGFPALYTAYGLPAETRADEIAASVWPLPGFSAAELDGIEAAVDQHDGAKARAPVAALRAAHTEADAVTRFAHLRDAFLTLKGTIRAQPFKAAIIDDLPHLPDRFAEAAQVVKQVADRLSLWRTLRATEQALVFAEHLIGAYDEAKRIRGLLDFDDLIERIASLLARQDVGPWIHYKLDKGIEHILIDEAQDTSPPQWQVLTGLAEEFFAGETSTHARRTVFAVGDEKQSIYSFQGARPEAFYDRHGHFKTKTEGSGGAFHSEELKTSFRSTGDILQAVDRVFEQPEAHRGLTQETGPTIHEALEGRGPGEVQLWPMVAPAESGPEPDWTAPVDHASQPAVVLADRIARVIAGWIGNGQALEAKGRPTRAGDIMVLVRKRGAFVHALSRRLKDLGVAVAGADRIQLAEHIAIMDLIALGRVCLQPADDLSLAAVLRSPLFDLSEEQLARIAIGRPAGETLHAALVRHAEQDAALAPVVEQLTRWRGEAGTRPAFDFYAGLLAGDGVRARLVGRLGREADDLIDEFLKLALAEERAGPPGLDAFLHTAESLASEIKREMDQSRDEVRIMTVHAAKGLEAPVVFLVDPGSEAASARHLPVLLPARLPDDSADGFLWRLSGAAFDARETLDAALRQRMEDEYRRLLYVGMTRAEDRLVVCGYRGQRTPSGTWLALVQSGLEAAAEPKHHATLDFDYLRFAPSPRKPVAASAEETEPALPPAPFAIRTDKARSEAGPPRPLAPSGASLLIETGLSADPAASPVFDAGASPPAHAAGRGTAIHKLLQVLPDIDPAERSAAAARYLAKRLEPWSEAEHAQLTGEVTRVLDDPQFAAVFAPGSQAETPVMGLLDIAGETRAVSGVIDRIAVTRDRVLIVDYKSSRPAPSDISGVPDGYLAQMAVYRALLRPLYAGKPVDAALLFTAAPRLIALPANVMDDALAAITGK